MAIEVPPKIQVLENIHGQRITGQIAQLPIDTEGIKSDPKGIDQHGHSQTFHLLSEGIGKTRAHAQYGLTGLQRPWVYWGLKGKMKGDL